MRLFVVDDLEPARLIVRAVAEDVGYEVVGEAEDGQAACEAIPALAPDVVIMDWRMPVMDGLEATRRLRTDAPDVRVIAYTSIGDEEVRAGFLREGAIAHVRKGDIGGLVDALQAAKQSR